MDEREDHVVIGLRTHGVWQRTGSFEVMVHATDHYSKLRVRAVGDDSPEGELLWFDGNAVSTGLGRWHRLNDDLEIMALPTDELGTLRVRSPR